MKIVCTWLSGIAPELSITGKCDIHASCTSRAARESFAGSLRTSRPKSPERREPSVACTRSSPSIESMSCPDSSNMPDMWDQRARRTSGTVHAFWIVTMGTSR